MTSITPRDNWTASSYSRPSYLTCKTCDHGLLIAKKKYRLSAPVVAIGYIFLIPALLGMAAAGLFFALIVVAAFRHTLPTAGMGAVELILAMVGVASFVSGLFGWILVMKKKVLQCTFCSGVVAAS